MIGEQNRLVDLELVELAPHHGRRANDLGAVRPPGPRDPELGSRRHCRQVEIALLDLRDLAQRDVPRWLGMLRELGNVLVDMHVGVDDVQVGERLARGKSRRRSRARSPTKIIR